MALVAKIQSIACDSNSDVAELLRISKVAAVKLKSDAARRWIESELTGYENQTAEDLPEYRILDGRPQAFNPIRGWIPIMSSSAEIIDRISRIPIGQSLPSLAKELQGSRDGKLIFPYPEKTQQQLRRGAGFDFECVAEISFGQAYGIIESVRDLILNWALELDAAGVRGEGIDFTESERDDAKMVSQNYVIENVGVIGALGGNARDVSVSVGDVSLDMRAISDLVRSIHSDLDRLPQSLQADVSEISTKIGTEVDSERPDNAKLRELLSSLRRTVEGASGNLTAMGIVQAVRALLGV